ncbi:hypothetical protein [Hyphomonas sp.]|uniref:hypothetical protein n=1 Tax=Hyphomonas sp. TaxID=87 RepID=UPI001BD04A27|nr:hypothetical protein [Hyphomonas sp.]
MIKFKILQGLCLAGGLGLSFAGSAAAKPDKPVTAATVDSGTGCLVRDADGNYSLDTDCKWTLTRKTDADGNITLYHYQDKGQLPEGAAFPSKALKTSFEAGCTGSELTTPSGQYSSDCKYNAANAE